MNAIKEALQNDRDELETRLKIALETGVSFYEYRILQRELEYAEHKLKAFENLKGILE